MELEQLRVDAGTGRAHPQLERDARPGAGTGRGHPQLERDAGPGTGQGLDIGRAGGCGCGGDRLLLQGGCEEEQDQADEEQESSAHRRYHLKQRLRLRSFGGLGGVYPKL